jgi:hypothetical protein
MVASQHRRVMLGLALALTSTLVAQTVLGQAPDEPNVNADTVDFRDAVGATVSRADRAKNLVATNREGRLPSNIIEPLWRLMRGLPTALADGRISWTELVGLPSDLVDGQVGWGEVANKPSDLADGQVGWGEVGNKPADLADGQVGWGEVGNKPAGFADGVDDGITGLTITEVFGTTAPIDPGATRYTGVACPAGSRPVSGGYAGGHHLVHVFDSRRAGIGWQVGAFNAAPDQQVIIPIVYCATSEPSSAINIARKGHKPGAMKKRR